MVNWLISWGLYTRIHHPWEMSRLNRDWFERKYRDAYAAKYLDSACSVASQLLHSWRKLGGCTSRRPYLRKAFARLKQNLVKVEYLGHGSVRLRITLAPRQWISLEARVHHKNWQEYLDSCCKFGELTIVPNGVRLLFQIPDERMDSERAAGVDLNLKHVAIATSDGRIEEMDISRAVEIQHAHRRKRQLIQRRLPTNLGKQHKLLNRDKGRERRRVKDILYEYQREYLAILADRVAFHEDLSTCTEHCLKNIRSRKFRPKLSSWLHSRFQEAMVSGSRYRSLWIHAIGTSSYCPFCGFKLGHPVWRTSRCLECGLDYDRDRLSAVDILIRGLAGYEKGDPEPVAKDWLSPEVVIRLREQCAVAVLLSSGDEGKTGEASASSRLWEFPTTPLFEGRGPFIPNAPSSALEGKAASAYTGGCRQGSGTAVMPMRGYGANTQDTVWNDYDRILGNVKSRP